MLGTEPGHLSGSLGTHIDIEGGEHTRTHANTRMEFKKMIIYYSYFFSPVLFVISEALML